MEPILVDLTKKEKVREVTKYLNVYQSGMVCVHNTAQSAAGVKPTRDLVAAGLPITFRFPE